MAVSLNSAPSTGSYASNSGSSGAVAPDPYGNQPAAINTADSYSGASAPSAPMAAQGATGMAGGLMSKLGLGHIIGWLGGGLLGWKVLLPKIAAKVAPKVPPSMWLKFGVIGGAALAGGWLVSKLLGHKAPPTA